MRIFLNQKMAQAWKDEETFKLIKLWGESNIQEEVEGCRRIKHIFYNYLAKWEVLGSKKVAHSAEKRLKNYKGNTRRLKTVINLQVQITKRNS